MICLTIAKTNGNILVMGIEGISGKILMTFGPRRIKNSGYRLWRMAGAARRSLPQFVIVGAQKAGTTALYSYLLQHPRVAPASRKEVHFVDLNWDKGERWYRSHFPTSHELAHLSHGESAITGEASPYYLFHPCAAERLAVTVPQARIIVLLRDPVKRAYSHYRHNVRKGEEQLPFADALARELRLMPGATAQLIGNAHARSLEHQLYSYLARGRYAEQLEPYLSAFPSEQILILSSEDLFNEPQRIYAQVLHFLGLEMWRVDAERHYNVGHYDQSDVPQEAQLRCYFAPFNQELYSLVQRDFGWW
jgi:sulfotransferase family protein